MELRSSVLQLPVSDLHIPVLIALHPSLQNCTLDYMDINKHTQIRILHSLDDMMSELVHDLRYCFNRIQVKTYLSRRSYGCFFKILVKLRNRNKTFLNTCVKVECMGDVDHVHLVLNQVRDLCSHLHSNYHQ